MSQLAAEALVTGLGPWADRPGPRYLRLADAVQDLLSRDSIADGCRLPAERELAELLGLSRGTVVAAYAALSERGVVRRRQGSGTRVIAASAIVPEIPRHASAQFGSFVTGPPPEIDMAFGAPYVDEDVWQLQGHIAAVMQAGAPVHGYAPLGLPGLREGIAARLTAQGTPTTEDRLLVTSGAQGALALLTQALVRPGDRVVVEAPTYPGAVELFARAGARIVPLTRDHTGPRPDDLRHALSGMGAALVFLVPTCHNPTGSIMHEQRRRELLRVCADHDVTVIEDLTPSELVYDGAAPPTLAAIDPESVISVGSFSKVLWGGLRVGWVRAPRSLILRLGRLKTARDLGSGLLDQVAVLATLGDLDAIVDRRRRQAKARHDHLVARLAERLPDWEVAPARGGYSLWVRIPERSGDELTAAALGRSVRIASGSASAPEDRFLDHIRLCFPAPPELLTEAVERLVDVWQDLRSGTVGVTPTLVT